MKRPHPITIHGHTRIDDYYWLRDDARQDPEVLAHLRAENAAFEKAMSHAGPALVEVMTDAELV